MNGLPATLTLAAAIVGVGCVLLLIVGYRADRRSPRPLTLHDLVPVCLCDRCLTDEDAAIIDHARRGAW